MICKKCSLQNFSKGVGKCKGCGGLTLSRAFKYCGSCSQTKNLCAVCEQPGTPVVTKFVDESAGNSAQEFSDSGLVLSSGFPGENSDSSQT